MLALKYIIDRDPTKLVSLILYSSLPSSKLWNEENLRLINYYPHEYKLALLNNLNHLKYNKKIYKKAVKLYTLDHHHESLGKSILYENIKDEEEIEENAQIVRTKSYDLEPMELEEAITRMEALGHNFFLYLDSEDEKISVLYKRDDGGYGIIEAENKVALK